MNRIDSEASKLSAFVEIVWDKKLWVLTTSCAVAAVSFMFHTYTTIPDQYLRNVQRGEMANFDAREGNSILKIFDSVKSLMNECRALFVFYDTYYGGVAVNKDIPADIGKQGIAICVHLGQEAALRTGEVRGIRLHNPEYARFRDNVLESMEEVEALVARFKTFIEAANKGSINEKREMGQLLAKDFNKTMATFISTVETSGNSAECANIAQTHEMESLIIELKWLNARFYLTIPALLYLLLYIVFAGRTYLKSRHGKSGGEATGGEVNKP